MKLSLMAKCFLCLGILLSLSVECVFSNASVNNTSTSPVTVQPNTTGTTISVPTETVTLPQPSLYIISVRNVLIMVVIALVLVAGLLLYRYCRSVRRRSSRSMQYSKLKSRVSEVDNSQDQEFHDEETSIYEKP